MSTVLIIVGTGCSLGIIACLREMLLGVMDLQEE